MTQFQTATWQEKNKTQQASWQSEANLAVPKHIVIANDETKADEAYKLACEGTALLYRGDFQNAKQLLQAITRRVDRKPIKPTDNLTEAFHQHRARQIQRANITNKILIELQHVKCDLNRAPHVKEAVLGALVLDEKRDKPPVSLLLSLRELLGMIGAHEWRKKGVYIDALQANVHAHYGVYSPVRGEYLELINQAPLNNPAVAFDIGTGTGVIAAILVSRGIKQVLATDNSERALRCATENIQQLGLAQYISVQQADMFPEGKADLIVCNPPWIPAKANAPIEHAIYDPNSAMLKAYLAGVKAHLNADGEAWLVMSDLAEHLGLRAPDALQQWIADAGLTIVEQLSIAPKHAKASDQSDPLYPARSKEVTSLYRLK
ncbi:methylase of polypeptide chain release factors [Methylophilaceae bacterium 11]|uniref:methyltransferase n=1 Tax=Methylotenera sp. N17 TaxID=1502761 RepID=UPI00044D4296|nr:class I SAM-dependent methyltransferase [Methylotenera sp. N17]EUJ10895.1 methylase of polypeptide chain release factors [Methylophilaceae bacterium 11]